MESRSNRHHTAADLAEATNTVLGIERDVAAPEECHIITANPTPTVYCRTSGRLFRLSYAPADSNADYQIKSLDYGTIRLISQAELDEDFRLVGKD